MTDPWLAPDSRPPDTAGSRLPVQPADAAAVEPRPVPTPMPLRPMTASDILDGAIAVMKTAPVTILVITATFVLPYHLLSAIATRESLDDRGFAAAISRATESNSSDSGFSASTIVELVLGGLILALVAGAVAHVVSSWYAERPAGAADGLSAALRAAPALIAAWLLVHVVEVLAGVALLVPLVFVMPLFMVVSPVIAIEHVGPLPAMRRSWSLARTRFSSVLGAALLVILVDLALTLAFGVLGGVLSLLPFGWIGDIAMQEVASLVTVSFVAAATTLVYFDLRIRSEGLDLEFGIAEHFARAS